jgi:hypothetical protein
MTVVFAGLEVPFFAGNIAKVVDADGRPSEWPPQC